MSDIKMGDVFELPVCVPVGDDDELKGDRLQHYAEFASRRLAMAAAEAINNHDRLTAENEHMSAHINALQDQLYKTRDQRYEARETLSEWSNGGGAKIQRLREEVERLREQHESYKTRMNEGWFEVEQERDQLKGDNQALQMKHDLLLAKIEAIQLRECYRDADVIERARDWVQRHQPNIAAEYNLLLSQYANQLRQQANEES